MRVKGITSRRSSPPTSRPDRRQTTTMLEQKESRSERVDLHQCASLVAWPPFRHLQLSATRKSCRLLHQADVNRGTGKDARSERRNYL